VEQRFYLAATENFGQLVLDLGMKKGRITSGRFKGDAVEELQSGHVDVLCGRTDFALFPQMNQEPSGPPAIPSRPGGRLRWNWTNFSATSEVLPLASGTKMRSLR